MKRFLIFPMLFPPLALLIFNAPDIVTRHDFMLLDVGTLELSYAIATIPALILAAVDMKWRSIEGTALAGAAMTGSIACFLWDGFRELFPAFMAVMLGGGPAAVCSWLSNRRAPVAASVR
jgi:hypothetical protein